MTKISIVETPAAWLPVAMSVAALSLVVGHVAMYGIVHQADEGAAAHIFQLLIAAQMPLVAYFAFKWLPREPGKAVGILALQVAAILIAVAAVYLAELA